MNLPSDRQLTRDELRAWLDRKPPQRESVPAALDGSYVVPQATLRTLGATGHDLGCMCSDCTGVLL